MCCTHTQLVHTPYTQRMCFTECFFSALLQTSVSSKKIILCTNYGCKLSFFIHYSMNIIHCLIKYKSYIPDPIGNTIFTWTWSHFSQNNFFSWISVKNTSKFIKNQQKSIISNDSGFCSKKMYFFDFQREIHHEQSLWTNHKLLNSPNEVNSTKKWGYVCTYDIDRNVMVIYKNLSCCCVCNVYGQFSVVIKSTECFFLCDIPFSKQNNAIFFIFILM